jgi:predicted phosphodiesterase
MAIDKSELVKEYIRYWENLPNRTLARKIYDDHSSTFSDIEEVRYIIRYIKGAAGKRGRKERADKTFFTQDAQNKLTLEDIEEGLDEREPNFVFPVNLSNMLVISDVHIPYHNAQALKETIKYGKENKVDSLLINGDFIDFAPLSEYTKDPYTKLRLKKDIDEARKYLQVLRNEFPEAVIYYKHGNHEDWYEKYLMKQAPVLLDMTEFKLEVILRLAELNITPISSYALMKWGKLSILHGHELKGTSRSVNPARTLYIKTKTSTLVSHHHVSSEHTESDIEGNITTCVSIGCLSQLKPKYAGLDSKYNLGFARVTKNKEGNFSIHNKRIVDGIIV